MFGRQRAPMLLFRFFMRKLSPESLMISQRYRSLSRMAVVMTSSPRFSAHCLGDLLVMITKDTFSCRAFIKGKKALASLLATSIIMMSSMKIKWALQSRRYSTRADLESDRINYSVEEGDVFFTRTSETVEEIGFSSTCFNTIPNAVFAGFLIRFRPFTNLLNKNFSKYYFRCELHRRFFVNEMNIVTRASLSQTC